MIKRFQPISVFKKDPYRKILAFPKVTESEIEKRIEELKKIRVTHVSFTGPLQIDKCHILGKGYVGMVVLAKKSGKIVEYGSHNYAKWTHAVWRSQILVNTDDKAFSTN